MSASGEIDTGVYKILLNGNASEKWLERIIQRIVVEDEINIPAMLSIDMAIMVNIQKSSSSSDDLLFIDDDLLNLFLPGTSVEVHMGLNSPEMIFSGLTAALSPRFSDRSNLEIVGFDPLYKLMFGKKNRSFADMTDSDIVSEIARGVNLTTSVDDTTTSYPFVFQNNRSDYDFILERAHRIGYEILYADGSLLFRKPVDSEQPEVTLQYGRDLTSFSALMKTLTEGSEMEFRGWDFRNKTGISAKSTRGDENVKTKSGGGSAQKSAFEVSTGFAASPSSVINDSVLDDGEAQILAKARYNEMAQKFISGEGRCPGNPAIRAGRTIEIKGVGSRFSGVYYIISSRHIWESGAYVTDFKVRRTLL